MIKLRHGFFMCEVCEELFDRRSNVQRYCDGCRRIALSNYHAEYHKKNRVRIRKAKREHYAANRLRIRAQQAQYYQETK